MAMTVNELIEYLINLPVDKDLTVCIFDADYGPHPFNRAEVDEYNAANNNGYGYCPALVLKGVIND